MKNLFEEPYIDVIKFSALDVFTFDASPEQGVEAGEDPDNAENWPEQKNEKNNNICFDFFHWLFILLRLQKG